MLDYVWKEETMHGIGYSTLGRMIVTNAARHDFELNFGGKIQNTWRCLRYISEKSHI